jgi:hypothetical protein
MPGKNQLIMIQKRLLRPDRVRQVPPSFNWVDHRLVRDRYIERCDCAALALYLFLITVSDVEGLSFYSDASICRYLKVEPLQLAAARRQLEQAELIAYRKPLYQVLALGVASVSLEPAAPEQRTGQTQSAADILKRVLQGGGQ